MKVWFKFAFRGASVIAFCVVIVAFTEKNESIAANLLATRINSIKPFSTHTFFVLIQDEIFFHVTKSAINGIGWTFVCGNTVPVINTKFCYIKEWCLTLRALIVRTNVIRIETRGTCGLV